MKNLTRAIPVTFIWYAAIAGVIIFSFFSFSYRYYPFFNSDAALAVLMSYDFHFPQDIYCWGQDRGGALEMMIAGLIISVFHTSPLITCSIVHYILLTTGLIATFHFVKRPEYRLALTVAWFFPSHFFIESVLYQFGIQFSMFMIGLYFFSKVLTSTKYLGMSLSLSLFFMIISVWVLDLGLIPLFFLFMMILSYYAFKRKQLLAAIPGFSILFSLKNIIITIAWLSAGALFIYYAKVNASTTAIYSETDISNLQELFQTLTSVFRTILVSFQMLRKPAESFYFYSVIVFLVLFIILNGKQQNKSHHEFFLSFFLWQSVFGIFFLMFSKQVLLAGVPIRYFSGAYLSLFIYLLMKLDNTDARPALNISLFIVLAASIASSLYESYIPKKLTPMVENFPVLKTAQPVGIVGSYWNAYVFSAIDPENLKATPHDQDNVRNTGVAYEALMQPRILLVQNEWLTTFPDSITQFGTTLIKEGDPFILGTYISWNEVNDVIACDYLRSQR